MEFHSRVVNCTRKLNSLSTICLDVIASDFDHLLDVFEEGDVYPKKYYKFLQRFYSDELMKQLKHKTDLSMKYIYFFVNRYIQSLNLDLFASSYAQLILARLRSAGKRIKGFCVTVSTYPEETLVQMFQLLPNIQSLCLNQSCSDRSLKSNQSCSDSVMQAIVENCQCLKVLDASTCFDFCDDTVRILCRQSNDDGNIQVNNVLEELNIKSSSVSMDSIMLIINSFPRLTKFMCNGLGEAICLIQSNTPFDSVTSTAPRISGYNFKVLHLFLGAYFHLENLRMCVKLCPHVTSLQLLGIRYQAEIDACMGFTELTEVKFDMEGYRQICNIAPFIEAMGHNLVSLSISSGFIDLKTVALFCPKLQELRLELCHFHEISPSAINESSLYALHSLKTISITDMYLPYIHESIKMLLKVSPNITKFTLVNVGAVTNDFVDFLIENCSFMSGMQEFRVFYSKLEYETIKKLVIAAPCLSEFELGCCYGAYPKSMRQNQLLCDTLNVIRACM